MTIRPIDPSGDILPVLSSADLLRGGPAVAVLAESRLNLFAGEWWENRSLGNEILNMLRDSRLRSADIQAVASYLTEYIRGTDGVLDVRDAAASVSGRCLQYRCTAVTTAGDVPMTYAMEI